MQIDKVLISTKKTALEHFKERVDFLEKQLPVIDMENLQKEYEEHYNSLNCIEETLFQYGIEFDVTCNPYAEYKKFQDNDLIICVGGDGTVLNSVNHIQEKIPILAIKSSTKSTGALCDVCDEKFEFTLEKILNDDFELKEWTRAEGIFKSKSSYALNEIFVGAKHSPSMTKYEIEIGDEVEIQMSSGIVIATGAGSTGWYNNIYGSDGKFPRTAKELRYIVREHKIENNYKMIKGHINSGETIRIKSHINVDGCISFDGSCKERMLDFNRGDVLEVKVAKKPVYVIRLKN